MIEPISRAKDLDFARYNNNYTKSNQNSFPDSEQFVQQLSKQIASLVKEEVAKTETEQNKEKVEKEKEAEKENRVDFSDISEKLREITGMEQVYFQFEIDKDNKKELIMKVVNQETQEVIQQFPTEISLKIIKMLEETLGRGQIANVKI